MNRVTTQFLKQEYKSVAKEFGVQVKELPRRTFMTCCGKYMEDIYSVAAGCVGHNPMAIKYDTGEPFRMWKSEGLGYYNFSFAKRYKIKDVCILVNGRYFNWCKLAVLYHEAGHVRCFAALPELESVAFPLRIACGAAGGDWIKYRHFIRIFAEHVGVSVRVYHLE